VQIRAATSADGEAVAMLLGELGYPANASEASARIERLNASSADHLVVSELDGEVVGLATLHVSSTIEHEQPVGKLSAIVVGERHRRRGVGEALAAAIEAEARSRGCRLVFLTSAERRHDAHAFYRRIGYEETGRRFAKVLA
jgi:N-acetylglutamate synthase-like GNAT family acetyltransferase